MVSLTGARAGGEPAPPTIESTYAATGPWRVETEQVVDGEGRSYVVHRPAALGAHGFAHPIVTWGNGTLRPEWSYAVLLEHLASWGFVTIASTSVFTGGGDEILAGAQYLVAQDALPGSVYHHRLATRRVAAIGHSQGAYGALNAARHSAGLVRTIVPISLPDPFWVSPEHAADLSDISQSVFFVSGSGDWLSTPKGILSYFEQIPGTAIVGTRVGALHDEILSPTDGYLGYVTAWLMYQLEDDAVAAKAFNGAHPELLANASWLVDRQPG